jgi:hypothetical protein
MQKGLIQKKEGGGGEEVRKSFTENYFPLYSTFGSKMLFQSAIRSLHKVLLNDLIVQNKLRIKKQ